MNLYTKTKIILRQTEWVILYKKEHNPQGWFENIIDKSIYQNILDPLRLIKKSTGEIFNKISFWYFVFIVILTTGLIILGKFYQYFPSIKQGIGDLGFYTPVIIYILSIFFTYFIFTFRMPSAIKQSFINEDNIKQIILNIHTYIPSEKEADLIDKNISDLAELSKRRKTIIRIITLIAIAYIFKEKKDNLTSITTVITIFIATLFEMYALGSRAIFTNAKLAVREIALKHNQTNISNKYEETNNLP
jgi:hypothetical protein